MPIRDTQEVAFVLPAWAEHSLAQQSLDQLPEEIAKRSFISCIDGDKFAMSIVPQLVRPEAEEPNSGVSKIDAVSFFGYKQCAVVQMSHLLHLRDLCLSDRLDRYVKDSLNKTTPDVLRHNFFLGRAENLALFEAVPLTIILRDDNTLYVEPLTNRVIPIFTDHAVAIAYMHRNGFRKSVSQMRGRDLLKILSEKRKALEQYSLLINPRSAQDILITLPVSKLVQSLDAVSGGTAAPPAS
eukprot:TRINITY_DN5082_c0_g1_i5.p1 TRINITY_DN5082_c0_g1~~TRINITY_DN5082_c0_g1_i5.p1  ORF type:complete len:240 (-),score=45.61 TRINITY_DN5082_c0_g1_i5:11-730(-)